MKVWLFAKRENTRACMLARKIASLAMERGFRVAVHPSLTGTIGGEPMPPRMVGGWADVMIVVGGDGTFIRCFHEVPEPPPILGVNIGGVGFLMEVLPKDVEKALSELGEGGWRIENRSCGLLKTGGREVRFINEAVVTSPHHNTLIGFQLVLDGEPVELGRADGFIVATPTGSTAYALSAGGPILDASLEALELIPLAPFNALLRPLVVSSERRIVLKTSRMARVVVDGYLTLSTEGRLSFETIPAALQTIKLSVSEPLSHRLRRRLLDITLFPSEPSNNTSMELDEA